MFPMLERIGAKIFHFSQNFGGPEVFLPRKTSMYKKTFGQSLFADCAMLYSHDYLNRNLGAIHFLNKKNGISFKIVLLLRENLSDLLDFLRSVYEAMSLRDEIDICIQMKQQDEPRMK